MPSLQLPSLLLYPHSTVITPSATLHYFCPNITVLPTGAIPPLPLSITMPITTALPSPSPLGLSPPPPSAAPQLASPYLPLQHLVTTPRTRVPPAGFQESEKNQLAFTMPLVCIHREPQFLNKSEIRKKKEFGGCIHPRDFVFSLGIQYQKLHLNFLISLHCGILWL